MSVEGPQGAPSARVSNVRPTDVPWPYPLAALVSVWGFCWNLLSKGKLKGTAPPLWMGKLRPGKGNHLPQSQGKFGAGLDLGVYLPGAPGETPCMPSSKISCPGYGSEGVEPHPGARHGSSMSPLSRELPAAVGGLSAQPVGAGRFSPTAPPSRGCGRGGAAWLPRESVGSRDNSRHAVWAQPGDP